MKSNSKIFLVDDDELIVAMLARSLKKEGYDTRYETSTENIIEKIENWYPNLVLLDINLPGRNGMAILQDLIERGLDTKIVMLTADNTAEMAIKALKIGAADYLTKPFDTEEVKIVISNLLEQEKLKDEVDFLRRDKSRSSDKKMLLQTDDLHELMTTANKLAEARVKTILITGESGTGKELIANHIHTITHSNPDSANSLFVTVNCTALPDHLFESELFGYVKGAFTDAKTDKKGLFELANGGSILLDEIGDMKEGLQAKLLRVLEERKIRKVGGKADIPIDVTVIATTNQDLDKSVKNGSFRRDLFHRLNTFPLHISPLRERKASIPSFANHFLSIFKKSYNKQTIEGFSPEAEKILTDYKWPGNVRELKNVIERIVVLEQAAIIEPKHLPSELFPADLPFIERRKKGGPFILPDDGINLEDFEADLYRQAFTLAEGNMRKAAQLLHVSYDTFRYQAKKYNLG